MPVLVLAGEEEFELSRRVERLKAEIVDPSWISFNLAVLNNPDLRQIIDAAGTLPFGPGKRLVLIDKCDLFTKKKSKSDSEKNPPSSEKAIKLLLDDFDSALQAVAPDTYLIFACPFNFDHTLRLSKVMDKYVKVEDFPKRRYFAGGKNPELFTWCRKEAHRYDLTIDDDAIAYLMESSEANLRQVSREIEKAAVYLMPEKKITYQVISDLSPHHSQLFALLDNWAAGKQKASLLTLEELLSKQSGMPIMAALHTTLSKWILIKALVAKVQSQASRGPGIQRREMPISELSDKLAGPLNMSPFVAKMELNRIKDLTADRLISKRIQLSDLDKMVKTGQMSDRHALTLFVAS